MTDAVSLPRIGGVHVTAGSLDYGRVGILARVHLQRWPDLPSDSVVFGHRQYERRSTGVRRVVTENHAAVGESLTPARSD